MKTYCGSDNDCYEEVKEMEVKTYLKDRGNKSEKGFIKKLKKLGALYYDKADGKLGGVIVIDRKHGDWLGVKLYIDGMFQIGTIDKDCDNFDCDGEYYKEEMRWLLNLFSKVLSK